VVVLIVISVGFVITAFVAVAIVGIVAPVLFLLQGNQRVAGLKRDQLISEQYFVEQLVRLLGLGEVLVVDVR